MIRQLPRLLASRPGWPCINCQVVDMQPRHRVPAAGGASSQNVAGPSFVSVTAM